MLRLFREFVKDEAGQDMVEYSLLLVLLGAVSIFLLTAMGQSVTDIFQKITNKLTSAGATIS